MTYKVDKKTKTGNALRDNIICSDMVLDSKYKLIKNIKIFEFFLLALHLIILLIVKE